MTNYDDYYFPLKLLLLMKKKKLGERLETVIIKYVIYLELKYYYMYIECKKVC